MLLFRSEGAVQQWCRRQGVNPGAILTLDRAWALATAWYHDRLDPDFRGMTTARAEAIFRHLGLDGTFWTSPPRTAT